jgi:hypothetical protein
VKKSTFVEEAPQQRWNDMQQMISDYDTLERNLKDLRTVLACICHQQEDLRLTVPFDALKAVPHDAQLEVSVDRVHGNYEFKLILADAPAGSEGTGLTGDDKIPS